MATLSETMTLAGFSARVTAGTLNIGQIYTISDKGWILQAHSGTIAKPLHGALRINIGDDLPEGIEPEEIIYITEQYTTPGLIGVACPSGYYIDNIIVNDTNGGDNSFFVTTADLAVIFSIYLTESPAIGKMGMTGLLGENGVYDITTGISFQSIIGLQLYIHFKRI